ncbi:MAG: U32 family peptidase [Deltaproteobacteria bacterium]|nr:U32 family peptidase [Deltaproteobacteria bacterium]
MELTIGPILYEWKREEVLQFYKEAAEMPVDRVYVGEVVCTKRRALTFDDIGGIIGMLEKAGKKVTLSSLAVVSNGDELEFTRRLCAMHGSIEANDVCVLNMVDPARVEVFAGAHITTYNAPSIEFLRGLGVRRVTVPVELPRESVEYIIKHSRGVLAEVFAHGCLPLAFSWRCYTSRAYGLSKTECRHHCASHPDGMELKTMDGKPLFRANGTSILSADCHTLVEETDDLRNIGVGALRISPQYRGFAKVADIFRARIDGRLGATEGAALLKETGRGAFCNGWYHGRAGKDTLTGAAGD